jgi:uncharacterized membrane protein YfcA
VPVLVYLVHHPEKQAIAESLAIVCGIALTASARCWLRGSGPPTSRATVKAWAPPTCRA